ncbi:MAG TPA: prolyl oligopeptidase family serine peptidase [Pyrinomonadaceae bacterium]|nr:prolyl oligopeptidase family serine peptidase [Pyrinomonadaceae bacterium]
MTKRLNFLPVFIVFLCLSAVFGQNLTVKDIMREPSPAGMRPESEKLSPDGKTVVYAWNAEGKEPRNLYIIDSDGNNSRILVNAEANYEQRILPPASKLDYGLLVRDDFVKAREKNLGGVEFSPDSKRILFLQNTDIYVLDLKNKDSKARRITRTQGVEAGARWLSNDAILYSSGGNYFVLNLKETSLVQVTKEANPVAFLTIFNVNPTKDGKLIAYVLSDGSKQKALFVPNYLDELVQANSVRRGFTEQKIFVNLADGSREKPFEVNLPKAEGAGFIRGLRWAADNSSLVVDRVDKDLKRRQIFYIHDVGSKAEQTILVTEETDEKWIASLSSLVEPNPRDNSQILFGSERDGFNHLYLATLTRAAKEPNPTGEIRQENPSDAGFTSKVDVKQLTSGKWQVEWAKWSSGGEEFVFNSTEETTAERQFYEYELDRNLKTKIFDSQNGMRSSPQLATEDGRPILLYEFSKWNAPAELFTIEVCPRCRGAAFPRQLTKSTPEAFLKTKWNEPKFVDIPARDGKFVKSKVYLPSNFNAKQKYPMVIFVHGAGYLQNTINGWNNYYREFMFNELLTQKGYVVLDIDYRGSAGYGRDWRTDVYDFLGGKDYEDHLDAIDYAVKNYAVDPQKVGVYGGSYGGFMAEMLAFRTDKIAAAAALRPVADWKNYYYSSPVYTAERLGFPEKNVEGYKRSSPIAYAEGLNKPLLILHGLVDDNVPAQDSLQLIEKLIRLEKTPYFEAMLYPSESHGFTRPSSWTDEYERIFAFFEKHLKN